jgi:hypothetical protein
MSEPVTPAQNPSTEAAAPKASRSHARTLERTAVKNETLEKMRNIPRRGIERAYQVDD